jgi:hypothetical protein
MTDVATSDFQAANEGPNWAPRSLAVQGGRFPLSVEAHLLNMTAALVPGATTVTTSARYFTLHGAVALEAERRQLDQPERLELLRRCEVVMAAASIVHPSTSAGTVHGLDAIAARTDGNSFDIETLATPRVGYSDAQFGFLGPYIGSEMTLGILKDASLVPGSRLLPTVLGTGFEGLFDLANQNHVSRASLESHSNLAIGALATSDDGFWLAQQLCANGLSQMDVADRTRAGTVRLLVRAALMAPGPQLVDSFRKIVAYGPWARTDLVVASIPEVGPWRGTLFRHDSVGAWRRLWAWLVDEISGPTRRSELISTFAESLPDMTLEEFERGLPPTVDAAGDPFDAESQLRTEHRETPSECLGLILLGAKRARELTGPSRAALVGNDQKVAVLSPIWVGDWVDNRRRRNIRDIAGELTEVLLDRAMRIAMSKMRMRDGHMWLPSVVAERGDFLYAVGREGRGNVGLRLDQLAGLLRGSGVLDFTGDRWVLASRGEDLLGGVR